MNKKTPKKILFLCISALCVFGIGNIHSIFVETEALINKFTVGENTIEIIEEFDPEDEIDPGDSFVKKPWVKNTGSVPCYVRMWAEFNDNKVAEVASVDYNNSDWTVKQSDGYYYYKKVLQPGNTTKPLFTTVTIASDADPEILNEFDIIIFAESVQSEGYSSFDDAFNSLTPSKD